MRRTGKGLAFGLPIPLLLLLSGLLGATPAAAFCGFYVAKADTTLFNRASKVVLVRDGNRTVLTMANDYEGDPKEFAIVIPVPTFLEKEQIHVGDRAPIEHLDAYTAPRLVEYFDNDPCQQLYRIEEKRMAASADGAFFDRAAKKEKSLGVTVEASYTVGEYDILILSAKESDGLETWLGQNGYHLPAGAAAVLGSYIKQKLRFFVAKVNLAAQSRLGFTYLRPLQVAYESPKFMLPIRLGTLNANGPQELFVFALTRTGRIETTNYRTIRMPADAEVPELVKERFSDFYRDLFSHQVERDGMRAVYLEYAWDTAWCDPCAADPLLPEELGQLGVMWFDMGSVSTEPPFRRTPSQLGEGAFVTRLHLRYTAANFPEDLVFQETGDRQNFQGRFVIRHPWQGNPNACAEAKRYFEDLQVRQEREAQTLANLTGWKIEDIRRGQPTVGRPPIAAEPWWKKLWSSGSKS